MTTRFTDEQMHAELAHRRLYTLVLLHAGPQYGTEESGPVIWEHGRRNFGLRADGLLPIVGPIRDDPELCGLCIFDADVDTTTALMAEDPAVAAGIFTFTARPLHGFPGDVLPAAPDPPTG